MQEELIVGDTLNFPASVPNYPATDGWTLTYRFVPRVSGTPISFSATAEGADYRVSVTAATTAGWAAGEYSWASYVSKSGERYSVQTGLITLKPDPGVATALDLRSQAKKMLDAVEAAILAMNLGAKSYTIGSRSWDSTEKSELIKMRNNLIWEVRAEEGRDRLANGLPVGGKLQVRF